MSGAIEFRLSNVSCTLAVTADDLLRATVSPGARTGRAMRFTIARFSAEGSGAIRVGEASATVNAVGPAIRTTHDVPRAAILGAPDVEAAEMSPTTCPCVPVLALPDVIGARTSPRRFAPASSSMTDRWCRCRRCDRATAFTR